MQQLSEETTYIAEPFKKHCKQANDNGIFFEGVHVYKFTAI
jgi:hypothetical protein